MHREPASSGIRDSGQGSQGYTRWIEGALHRGVFGGAKLMGRPQWQIDVFRCPRCKHLEMFATDPVERRGLRCSFG